MTTAENGQSGIVYILTNEAMPGYIKIGHTHGGSEADVRARMSTLYSTSVPLPFECVYAAVVEDAPGIEKKLHTAFEKDRRSPQREFFEGVPLHSAIAALKIASGRDVTPRSSPEKDADGKQVSVKPSKRPPLTFSMVQIDVGTELLFIRDENITCTVEDDRHVKYQGETTALSPLTQKLLGYATTPGGPDYWLYEGETLSERRMRLEDEEASSDQA